MDQRLLMMHQAMLADRARTDAYDKALAAAVRPGDVVVDVGAGVLPLTLLALRHGAGHVYAVEADPAAAAMAELVIADNDIADRVTLVQGDARVARLPRADVLVCELMGNLGPEEDMMAVLAAVSRRCLAPGGRIVPSRLTTSVTPIEFDGEGWGIWGDDFLGHRMGAIRDRADPVPQLHSFQRPPVRLGPSATVVEQTPDRPDCPVRSRAELEITEPGTLHAVVAHFTADLADGVALGNFPTYPGCNWAVWMWPLRHVRVAPGTRLAVELVRPADRRAARLAEHWRLDCGLVRTGSR